MNLGQNHQDVLKIIIQNPDSGIGWYGLERVLSILNHPISKDGILMSILKDLLENELITSISTSVSQHPSYVITEKGVCSIEELRSQN